MSAERGEVYLAQQTVLPGGIMYLVVSGHEYNLVQPHRRIVVEVVGDKLAAAGDLLFDLAPIGTAVLAAPTTIPASWLEGDPIATLPESTMTTIAAKIARHFY